jgi:dipeptidyl aminopeptidase/acylaminoacyl peptidase
VAAIVFITLAVPAQADAPAPIEAYGDLPGLENVAISPSGQRIAIIGRVNGARQLVMLNAAREPIRLAPVSDMKIRDIEWIGEDQVMLIHSGTRRLGPRFTKTAYELSGALVVPVDANLKFWSVFGNSQALAKSIYGDYGTRLIDGKWQGYFGGIEFDLQRTGPEFVNGHPALFAVDMAKTTTRKLARASSDGVSRSWRIDAKGEIAATFEIADGGRWEITNAAGKVLANGFDPTGDVNLLGLGKDGTTILYALESASDGKSRWFEVPLAGGAPVEFFADAEVDRLLFDPTSGWATGYVDGASAQTHFFDPAREAAARKVLRAFPKLRVSIRDWTPDFSRILVHTEGNGDSGTWYLIDMARMKADVVGDDHPLIVPDRVGPISTVSYKASDGLDLDGILTLPPGREARNLPVILFPHGGPQAHDVAGFDWWAQALASRGYAVLQPNFRGSTNRDDAFRRSGYGEWGRKMQTDISDGLADLARKGIVDPKRACIMGASYGGFAALAGVTLQQGLYRCAVAVAPVSDLGDLYQTRTAESGDSRMTWRSLRESLGQPSTFAAVSPRRHAAQADAPILLIHGKDDTVVDFQQSTAMASALRAAGKPHELVVLREEDHWLSRSATRKQMLEATLRFVQQHNPAN